MWRRSVAPRSRRSRFEQANLPMELLRRRTKIASPECFISYAWGNTLTRNAGVEKACAGDGLAQGRP